MESDAITSGIIGAACNVHSALGPGLLECVYQLCLVHEFRKRGMRVRTQVAIPIVYDGLRLNGALRLDLLVEEEVIVELKATEGITPVHKAQLLSYLRLSGKRVGLLLNFNVVHMRFGIHRLVNGYDTPPPSSLPE